MNRGKQKIASTQSYLPIKEIREDVVVMSDSSLRTVLIISSVNFALKSEQEKDAIISSYQGFLNSLGFPIQIVASSKKLHLNHYLGEIKEKAQNQENPLLKVQTEEYVRFVEKLLEVSNIMEKRFYVIVPYFPAGVNVEGKVGDLIGKKPKVPAGPFADNKKKLLSRVDRVIEGLTSVGLRCSALGTKDLLELYYTSYNPDTAENQKLIDIEAIDNPIVEAGRKKDGSL